ncbi:hypothetical protein DERF_005702 [Dermatophagoides farinae]|uniref:Uncharacterized protein n=1 Tax=Dermatophagoides farinae TaxID=6954 RepID=A0A922L6V5_DERFA|nr:hypothetical protein DERF_005702 [Dermatophagoides farinae]
MDGICIYEPGFFRLSHLMDQFYSTFIRQLSRVSEFQCASAQQQQMLQSKASAPSNSVVVVVAGSYGYAQFE